MKPTSNCLDDIFVFRMLNLSRRLICLLIFAVIGLLLAGCQSKGANYRDPFDPALSPAARTAMGRAWGGPSVRVVLSGNTATSMKALVDECNLAVRLMNSAATIDPVDPQHFQDELTLALLPNFRRIEFVYWNAAESHSDVDYILTLEISAKFGGDSFTQNVVNLQGVLSRPGSESREILVGHGVSTTPYPADPKSFTIARRSAFVEFGKRLDNSQLLAAFKGTPHVSPNSSPQIMVNAFDPEDPPKGEGRGGLFDLESKITFNVLDRIYYDPTSGELALTGHHDDKFKGPAIPYLQHLAVLLRSPKPEFSLTWTPDSEQRVNALFNWHPSSAEGEKITAQWGNVLDEQGNVTKSGRLLLSAIGVSLKEGKNANAADVLTSIYLANGDQHAASVMNALSVLIASTSPASAASARRLVINTLNLGNALDADQRAVENNTMSDLNAFIDIDTKECQGFDEALHFSGSPVKDAFVRSYKQIGGDPANSMKVAMTELGQQLVPKIEDMMNSSFKRPEGIQIPSELVEDQFHIHPEMIPQYLGIPSDSLLAADMLEADYLCKKLMYRPDLKKRIPEYQTAFEFEVKHPQFRHTTGNYRIWISVDKMDTAQSMNETTLVYRTVAMRFNIREQSEGSTSSSGKDLPNKAGGYEELLTSQWDSFEREYPPLHELREAAKLAAAAKWIILHNPKASLPEEGKAHWQGPAKVPGFVFLEMSPDPVLGINKTTDTFIAQGGVSLVPFPASGKVVQFPTDSSVVDLRSNPTTTAIFNRPDSATIRSAHAGTTSTSSPYIAGWVTRIAGGTAGQEALVLDSSSSGPPPVAGIGQFGTNVAQTSLSPVGPSSPPGADTKAGDQLLSAAANAAKGSTSADELRPNFDGGKAQPAGSLVFPSPSVDPKDPKLVSALKVLNDLQAKRAQLDVELQQLIAKRGAESDPKASIELTKQVDEINNQYQANLVAITQAEESVKKVRRTIEIVVEQPPAASSTAPAATNPSK